ncbi:MAG: YlxM family DNA-binding protein [Negativicutes bacterium]|nr:YlxM family DNA-binding protein [Negativicutes bacterium]
MVGEFMTHMLDKLLRIGMLYDFYGALLTDKQRQQIEMHYLNDLSLSEIADELKVSRQAVHDNLRRAEHILEGYERRLSLVERHQQNKARMAEALAALQQLPQAIRILPEIQHAERILEALTDQ